MDRIKKMLLNELATVAKDRIDKDVQKYEKQLKKREKYCDKRGIPYNRDNHYCSRQAMINRENSRHKDRKWVYDTINDLNFVDHIPEEFKEYISPYHTFCDRYTMYYDDMYFLGYNKDEVIQMLMFELFNALSNYFTFTHYTDKQLNYVRGTTFIAMYHIGLLKNKCWYSKGYRTKLVKKYEKKYKEHIMSFRPNQKAGEYLLQKAVFDDSKQKFSKPSSMILKTDILTTAELFYKYLLVDQSFGLRMIDFENCDYKTNEYSGLKVYFNKNQERCNALKNEAQETKEIIQLTKKLSQ